jgi:hypothetical protein
MPNHFATQFQCVALVRTTLQVRNVSINECNVGVVMSVTWVFDHTYCVNSGIFVSELCEREKDAHQNYVGIFL